MAEDRYEPRDLRASLVAWGGLATLVAVAVVLVSLLSLTGRYGRDLALETAARRRAERALPPTPRLQSDPPSELAAVIAAERKHLSEYAWADAERRHARIPIERAMDLTAGRLPERGKR